MAKVMIRFEYGQEDRFSVNYGPYEFIQATYDSIRVGEDGDRFLATIEPDGRWRTDDGQIWSDFIVGSWEN